MKINSLPGYSSVIIRRPLPSAPELPVTRILRYIYYFPSQATFNFGSDPSRIDSNVVRNFFKRTVSSLESVRDSHATDCYPRNIPHRFRYERPKAPTDTVFLNANDIFDLSSPFPSQLSVKRFKSMEINHIDIIGTDRFQDVL